MSTDERARVNYIIHIVIVLRRFRVARIRSERFRRFGVRYKRSVKRITGDLKKQKHLIRSHSEIGA